jgi:aldehyde dehydrogenase (NAD(P)+)
MTLSQKITLPDGTQYEQPLGLFINNEFVEGSGDLIETYSPHSTELITSVHAATAKDVDHAVSVARKTYNEVWRHIEPSEKGKLLWRLADLMEVHGDLLAKIDALDAGKPFENNAKNDITQSVALCRYYAGYADKISGKYTHVNGDKFIYEVQEPYGVVGQIVPWNYPLAMAQWKILGAIAAGNTVVIKSAENTPLSLLYFGNVIKETGFPPGVVNIISGLGQDAGSAIASHMDVDKVAFTGSTNVGKLVQQQAAASNLKAVTLECGGKSPCVVFDDANLESAVRHASLGIFYNSGQNCTANSRIILHESIHDKFLVLFKQYVAENWIVGDPFDPKTTVGPLVSKVQRDRVQSYIDHGVSVEKLERFMGNEPIQGQGYYIPPTVFINVPISSKLWQEEIFGPVAVVCKFSTYEEALKLANETSYGLGSAVFTENIKRAHKFAAGIQAGTVWINSSNDEDIKASFGGYKQSGEGSGRELGEKGLLIYTQTKAIHVNLDLEGSKL